MPYIIVEDFSRGLDTRKSWLTSPAGTLRIANNVHITSGGEVEKRKAFVQQYTLPAGTIGLVARPSALFVFGTGASPDGLPSNVVYQQINEPTRTLGEILDHALWQNDILTAAQFTDGYLGIYRDGTPVTWNFSGPRGQAVEVLKSKAFAVQGVNLYSSEVSNVQNWGPTFTGSAVVDIRAQATLVDNLRALGVYQSRLAVMGRDSIQIWSVDPDPALTRLEQVLPNIGCLDPRTVVTYGSYDLFFLSQSGVRSLQVRDQTELANSTDVGTPVDSLVTEGIKGGGPYFAVLEPTTNRYWLAIGDTIFVHSFFPGSDISAWSTYTPGFPIDGMVASGDTIWLRSGDDLYAYGGATGDVYDDALAEVALPFLDAQQPATMKTWTGIDCGAWGTWSVSQGIDVNNPDALEPVGALINSTYDNPNTGLGLKSTHYSAVFRSTEAARVRLFNACLHYQSGEAA